MKNLTSGRTASTISANSMLYFYNNLLRAIERRISKWNQNGVTY